MDPLPPHLVNNRTALDKIASAIYGPSATPIHVEHERRFLNRKIDALIVCDVGGALRGIIIEIKAVGDRPSDGQARDLGAFRIVSLTMVDTRVLPVEETRHVVIAPERHTDFHRAVWQHLPFTDVFMATPSGLPHQLRSKARQRIDETIAHELAHTPYCFDDLVTLAEANRSRDIDETLVALSLVLAVDEGAWSGDPGPPV